MQVPAYLAKQSELKAKGISEVVVYSVNDMAVMEAWAKDQVSANLEAHLLVASVLSPVNTIPLVVTFRTPLLARASTPWLHARACFQRHGCFHGTGHPALLFSPA
jgi:hypothetical protein